MKILKESKIEDNHEIEAHIEDISVNFGSNNNLLSIDLYCELIDWR